MARKGRSSKGKRRKATKSDWNFVDEAGPGCHIARPDAENSFVLEWEDVKNEDFGGQEVPDIAIDPDEGTLSLCNLANYHVVAYITVFEAALTGVLGKVLEPGQTIPDDTQSAESCTTLIVLCPPQTFAHLCYIDLSKYNGDIGKLRIESDVQEWNKHPNPDDTHPSSVGFPLDPQSGPYLCTQGEGGQLTHFFSGNLHAIDFRCPIGTPVLAVRDGIILEAKANHSLTGVAVSNLFQWNSIIIQVKDDIVTNNDPLFVEYVHISSTLVKAGECVHEGQVIGTSGSVGFSPEPHLHFCAYRSQSPTAPTVRVRFHTKGNNEKTFLPRAGQYCNDQGPIVR